MNACYTNVKMNEVPSKIDLRKDPIKTLDCKTELKEKTQRMTEFSSQTIPSLLRIYLARRVLSRRCSKSHASRKKAKLISSYSETELQTSTALTTTTRKIIRKVANRFKTNSTQVVDLLRRLTNNFRLDTDLK